MPNISLARRVCLPALPWRLAALVFLLLMTAAAHAQSREPAFQAINAFENATHDYVLMHRRLEQQIGSIEFATPAAEINRIMHDLVVAIRAERADAKQGDFFTPSLARVLRTRIKDSLLEDGHTADDVRASRREAGVDYERVRMQVNDTFPWRLSVGMFPRIIEVLPPLPPELQCRSVGDDLILVDVHASLTLDILPHALNDLTARNSRPQGDVR